MDPEDVKKISKSVIRAFMERHRTRCVSIIIEDLDSIRRRSGGARQPHTVVTAGCA
jgi:hypothetical protein